MRHSWNAYRTVSNKLAQSNSRSRLFRVLKIILQNDTLSIFTVLTVKLLKLLLMSVILSYLFTYFCLR